MLTNLLENIILTLDADKRKKETKNFIEEIETTLNVTKTQADTVLQNGMISEEVHKMTVSGIESIRLFADNVSKKAAEGKNISVKELNKIKQFIENLDMLSDSLKEPKKAYRATNKSLERENKNLALSEAKITQLTVEKSKILDSGLSNESKEVKEIEDKIVRAAEDIKKYQIFSKGNAASVAEKRQKIEQLYKKCFEEKFNKLPIRKQLNELNIAKEQNNKILKFKANIIAENKAQKAE